MAWSNRSNYRFHANRFSLLLTRILLHVSRHASNWDNHVASILVRGIYNDGSVIQRNLRNYCELLRIFRANLHFFSERERCIIVAKNCEYLERVWKTKRHLIAWNSKFSPTAYFARWSFHLGLRKICRIAIETQIEMNIAEFFILVVNSLWYPIKTSVCSTISLYRQESAMKEAANFSNSSI